MIILQLKVHYVENPETSFGKLKVKDDSLYFNAYKTKDNYDKVFISSV